jgi:hypothetical protein
LLVILSEALFAESKDLGEPRMGRVLCDPTKARLARFLIKLHHYPKVS